jgi:hypothetical protein
MVRVFLADIFDGKVVNYKYKGDGAEGMEP